MFLCYNFIADSLIIRRKSMMPELLNLIAVIIIFGVIMWLINMFIPMPAAIKSLLNIVVLIVLIIYVLQFFKLISPILPVLTVFH